MDKIETALSQMLLSTDKAVVADACAVQCLRLIASDTVETAATDGLVILYNPAYTESLTLEQCKGLLVHEVCHVRFAHTERFSDGGFLDHDRANRSMDREINPLVSQAGYALPPDGCWPSGIGQPDFLSFEDYYQHETSQNQQKRPSKARSQGGEGNQGQGAESSPESKPEPQIKSGVHQPGSLAEKYAPDCIGSQGAEQTAKEVAEAVADQSLESRSTPQQAKKAGAKTASVELSSGELVTATNMRWQDCVIEVVGSKASRETIADWSRPSRRCIGSRYYRPARKRVEGLRLALVLDVSGSCISYFSAWQSLAREMVDSLPQITELEILYHDTQVKARDNWQRRSGDEIRLKSNGGGGTCHRQVLAEVEALEVDAAILFTDSESYWPDSFGGVCVTVQPPDSVQQTPFGTTIRINQF